RTRRGVKASRPQRASEGAPRIVAATTGARSPCSLSQPSTSERNASDPWSCRVSPRTLPPAVMISPCAPCRHALLVWELHVEQRHGVDQRRVVGPPDLERPLRIVRSAVARRSRSTGRYWARAGITCSGAGLDQPGADPREPSGSVSVVLGDLGDTRPDGPLPQLDKPLEVGCLTLVSLQLPGLFLKLLGDPREHRFECLEANPVKTVIRPLRHHCPIAPVILVASQLHGIPRMGYVPPQNLGLPPLNGSDLAE